MIDPAIFLSVIGTILITVIFARLWIDMQIRHKARLETMHIFHTVRRAAVAVWRNEVEKELDAMKETADDWGVTEDVKGDSESDA